MTANQIIATSLFCCVLPTFLLLGGWTGLVSGAWADERQRRENLKAMERHASDEISGGDKWAARKAAKDE